MSRSKKPTELRLLMNDVPVGTIRRRADKLSFEYDDAYRQSITATTLSLSMPLTQSTHQDPTVSNFFWGLLPDNPLTLAEWARRAHVSPRSVFQLIGAVGEELPGAIQAGTADDIENFAPRMRLQKVSDQQLNAFVTRLVKNPGLTQITDEGGRFSLAGAQAKKAICWINEAFYEPVGRTPTTHILKPPIPGLAGQVENEHFCLSLARALGLRTARSRVLKLRDTIVILLDRYDRLRLKGRNLLPLEKPGGQVVRIHQEDLCQALGLPPSAKYQAEGGPGMASVMLVLANSRTRRSDQDQFMRACALNFLIGGTDAHAKNYSILHLEGGTFRLAPLYDVISALPYLDRRRDRKLAMSVGGEYHFDKIEPRHWEREAIACGYERGAAMAHLRDLIAKLPDASSDVLKQCEKDALAMKPLLKLNTLLTARCRDLSLRFGAEQATPA